MAKWWILHYTSILGMWMLLYGLGWMILHYTAGFIPFIRNTKLWGVPLELPLFSVIVIAFILRFIEISSPYADRLK